jgi:hypothetical protein
VRVVKRNDRVCPSCGAANRRGQEEEPPCSARVSRARWLALSSTLAIAGCSGDATLTAMNPPDATASRQPPRRYVESGATQDSLSDSGIPVIDPEVMEDAGTQDGASACLPSDARVPFAPASGTFPCGNVMCDRATQWCHAASGGALWNSCRPLATTCADPYPPGDAGCGNGTFCWYADCDGGLRRCACVTTCGYYGWCSDDDAGGITVGCGPCYGAPPARLERLARAAPVG